MNAYAIMVDRDGLVQDIAYNYDTAETLINECGWRAQVVQSVEDAEKAQVQLDYWYDTCADCFGWED